MKNNEIAAEAALPPATGSDPSADDGRVYQFNGVVNVGAGGALIRLNIPQSECPTDGQYVASIILWVKPNEHPSNPDTH